MPALKIVTRKSTLALRQVEEVVSRLPGLAYTLIPRESYGDRHREISLLGEVPADFFTRELDAALLDGTADVAVHSAKDVAAPLPEGLNMIALTEASDQTDALVSRGNVPLKKLPAGARIGTSSSARKQELLTLRPDLCVVPVRGTVEERLRLVDEGALDALVVASCALKRLGLAGRIADVLPLATHPLQGHLAVVARQGRPALQMLFGPLDVRRSYGRVYIVGAGAGTRDLLTMKADTVLRNADVIFHDDLIDKELLSPYRARKAYVGKRKGRHHASQDGINRLLFEAARKGQVVARLKGGDPFVFGRGGEEMSYLAARHVDVEIVPGVSAAQAAAAGAGVPLTMRGVSAGISLISGHRAAERPAGDEPTLVYYMGATRLNEIAASLKEKGVPPATPAVLVRRAGFADEEVTTATAGSIGKETAESPLIVIVGTTAAMYREREKLLFTGLEPFRCPVPGKIVHYPLIAVEPRDVAVDWDRCDGLIFTSKQAVRALCGRYRIPGGKVIVSIGPATTRELAAFGCRADVTAAIPDSDELARTLKKYGGRKFLYPCSSLSKNALHRLPNVEAVTAYVTRHVAQPRLDLKTFSGIVFTSPSTVDGFFGIYRRIPRHIAVTVYGKHTAERLRKHYDGPVQTVPPA